LTGRKEKGDAMKVEKLDKWIGYALFLYAFVSCISIAAANIAISLAAVLAAVRLHKKRVQISEAVKPVLKGLAVFFAAMALSAMAGPGLRAGGERLWAYVYRAFPFFLCLGFLQHERQRNQLLLVTFLSLLIADIYAIYQGTHGDWRAQGFSSHPMIMAGYLLQVIPLALVYLTSNDETMRRYRWGIGIVFLLSNVALLYNGTRGAWLAVFCVYLLYGMLLLAEGNGYKALGIVTTLVVIGLVIWEYPPLHARLLTLVNRHFESNTERILMWQSAWHMFLDYPLLGVGLGHYAYYYQHVYISPLAQERLLGHAHNNFFQMLAETGLIGFGGFCYMFLAVLRSLWSGYRQYQSTVCLGVFLTTVALLVQGLTEFNFGDSAVIRLYWFLLGIALWSITKLGVFQETKAIEKN
jgi:O-antigen ligase